VTGGWGPRTAKGTGASARRPRPSQRSNGAGPPRGEKGGKGGHAADRGPAKTKSTAEGKGRGGSTGERWRRICHGSGGQLAGGSDSEAGVSPGQLPYGPRRRGGLGPGASRCSRWNGPSRPCTTEPGAPPCPPLSGGKGGMAWPFWPGQGKKNKHTLPGRRRGRKAK